MLEPHPLFNWPADQATLWRYLPFEGLLSYLHHESLWLARADTLGDSHEGAYGAFNRRMRRTLYPDLPDDVLDQMEALHASLPSKTFVSCWHLAEEESAAMWEIYAGRNRGVCLKTTFGHLRDGVTSQVRLFGGMVTYSDSEHSWTPEGNTLSTYLRKRLFFEHEKEFRLVTQDFGEGLPLGLGFWIEADIATLAQEVIVAPGTDPWVTETIARQLHLCGLTSAVSASRMDTAPIF